MTQIKLAYYITFDKLSFTHSFTVTVHTELTYVETHNSNCTHKIHKGTHNSLKWKISTNSLLLYCFAMIFRTG